MSAALYQSRIDRRRAASLLLAVAAHLLLVWLLLRLGPSVTQPRQPPRTATFTMLPDAAQDAPKAAAQRQAASARPASAAAPRRAPTPPVTPPPDSPAPVPPPAVPPPPQAQPRPADAPAAPSLFGDKSLFDAGDIAGLSRGAGSGAGTGRNTASVYGPGEGAGGQQLFNADWYREPTHAELSTYLPANVPAGSWGIVACQTTTRFHVENCRSIGEGPRGSGIGRALRLAAWQFLVVPPRKGGQPMIGAWVRIRIDFTESGIRPH